MDRLSYYIDNFKAFVKDNPFAIYGAGFLGKFLISFTEIGSMNIKCMIDDNASGFYKNIPILKDECLESIEYVLVAISYPREELLKKLENLGKKVFLIDGTIFTLLGAYVKPDILLDEDYGLKVLKRDRNVKKILILKLDYFGDSTMTLPSLYYLRYKYPNATIDAILTNESAFVLSNNGIFDNVYISKEFSRKKLNAMDLSQILNSLPEYDIAIDIGFGPDTRYILNDIKAKLKAGFETKDADLDIAIPIFKPGIHANDLIKELIDKLPIYVKSQKQKNTLSVAMFPAASNPMKEWELSEFFRFLELLENDEDINTINLYFDSYDSLNRFGNIPYKKVSSHVGLDFNQLKNHLQTNDIFVGVDSFGSHISSFVGLPCIVIFFDFSTIEFAPIYSDTYIILRQSPYPLKKPFVKAKSVYSVLKKLVEF